MKIIDLFFMSLSNLYRRKIRTFLTSLGVLIGSTSIIVMLSLSFALDKNTIAMFEQIGGLSNIRVYPSDQYMWDMERSNSNKDAILDNQAIEKISNINGVKSVTSYMEFQNVEVQLLKGKDTGWAQVYGVDFKNIENSNFRIGEGALPINKYDAISGQGVAEGFMRARGDNYYPIEVDLLKDKFELSFIQYNSENPEVTRINKKINISGVLEPSFDMSNYYFLISKEYFIEIADQINKTIKNNDKIPTNKYSIAEVRIGEDFDIVEIQDKIKDMGFSAESNADYYNEIKKNLNSTRILFFVVGAVAFVVAAIGIANTMIMSVYERTKEIGIMKVIGASIKDIRNMFLVEAGIIGLIGGLISIIFSYSLSYILNKFVGPALGLEIMASGSEYYVSYIPVWLPFVGVAFSTFIGVLSGYLPSRRATQISAIEAIRYQ